ncbi:hypothetical protein Slu03_05460 [Sediminihabitans luteus]|nr:maleylpyruvate isomerase N-terminal domain-containing protein [Sediminihabitans luteus]GII98168.1 hypothetical protein Slu03_05460 [Sediminihabitans luteus]
MTQHAAGSPALDHLAELARVQDLFADAVRRASPDAPVPGCSPWTVTDLVEHVAGVHRWAAGHVRAGLPDGAPAALRSPADADPGAGSLAERYAPAADELRAVLAAAPPSAVVPTLVGDAPSTFWRRRQLHEVLVHLVDVEAALAAGDLPGKGHARSLGVGPAVWADAVDEIVHVMAPRQVALGRLDALPSVRLVADDVPGPGPDAPHRVWELGSEPDAVEVRGPARELALRLWRREGDDAPTLTVAGEPRAWQAVLASALTP